MQYKKNAHYANFTHDKKENGLLTKGENPWEKEFTREMAGYKNRVNEVDGRCFSYLTRMLSERWWIRAWLRCLAQQKDEEILERLRYLENFIPNA